MTADALPGLAARVGAALKARGQMLAVAESCTGGWVAQALTTIAGSSDWFERGFVTYSNAAKEEMLGVSAATLAAHGAVSEPTAREMARGALARSHAQLALAITGIAGPSGGSAQKPVGTVYIALASPEEVEVWHYLFRGNREAIKILSAQTALDRLRRKLLKAGVRGQGLGAS